MHDLNSALDGLREVMPYAHGPSVRKLSKIATLLLARNYILMLNNSLDEMKKLVADAHRQGALPNVSAYTNTGNIPYTLPGAAASTYPVSVSPESVPRCPPRSETELRVACHPHEGVSAVGCHPHETVPGVGCTPCLYPPCIIPGLPVRVTSGEGLLKTCEPRKSNDDRDK